VIADAVKKEALVVEATRSHVAFFRDDDPKEKEAAYAFTLPQAVFRGDPALDPTIRELQTASGGEPEKPGLEPPTGSAYEIRYLKHGHLVQENYGKITTETAQSIAHELAPKSNIQSVVYEFPEFCVANAEGDKRAVDSGYYHFNFEELEARASSAS
ncbi:MAG TPA: hypothetical protein VL688_09935, partial [Verrucomicrobiae bacterium]|nr:hypothetical protein [Verrucomicrobiae bacterium]